jgi:hypothetical protein
VHPSEYFRAQTYKCCQFDEAGLPTDGNGETPISRGQANKIKKEYDLLLTKYTKLHPVA